jgi:hypothetical protein
MDTLTLILLTTAGLGLVVLIWLSGYEFGSNDATNSERALCMNAIKAERASANKRVDGLLAELNKLKPRANAKRRARK